MPAEVTLEDILQSDSILLWSKDLLDESEGFEGEQRIGTIVQLYYILYSGLFGVSAERLFCSQHVVECHSQTPHISRFGVIGRLCEYFRCHIGGGAADGGSKLILG